MIITAIITILLASDPGFARQSSGLSERQVQTAVENLSVSLESDVPGIVESALYNSVMLVKRQPDAPVGPLVMALKSLHNNSESSRFRHQAYLALTIMQAQHIDLEAALANMGQENFFEELSAFVSRELLNGSN